MNEERIEQLASTVAQAPHLADEIPYGQVKTDHTESGATPELPGTFALNYYRVQDTRDPDCGTVGCIAGYCVALFPDDIERSKYDPTGIHFAESVSRALDISFRTACSLVSPDFMDWLPDESASTVKENQLYKDTTPQDAAQAVRNLLNSDVHDMPTDLLWGHVLEREELI